METGRETRAWAQGLELWGVSALALFQELALIRWIGGQLRVAAYFPNLILLASFLGLGLGCLRAERRGWSWGWGGGLLLLILTVAGMSRVAFTSEVTSEHLWLLYYDLPPDAPVVPSVRLPLLLVFALTTLAFVPLGREVGRRLAWFGAEGRPLLGYLWDLLGSLTGVVLFTLLSWLGTFPLTWFGLLGAGGVLLLGRERRGRLLLAGCVLLGLVVVQARERASRYSPYYAIGLARQEEELLVSTNGSLHQVAFRAGPWTPSADADPQRRREGYHLPYRLLGREPGRVLVLGAGTGNDVSVALSEGATHVDAVEIDPVIQALGRAEHPDRPYDSPRVRPLIGDARTHLERTDERYDLIVYGTLDSMTRLSAQGNVRLDNFVYTLDGLRAAARRLSPQGGVALYFAASEGYIADRLAGMIREAFGDPVLVVRQHYGLFNLLVMAGPAFAGRGPPWEGPREQLLPSDDWPYLYLRAPEVGPFYGSLLGAIFAFSLVALLVGSRALRGSLVRLRAGDLEMLLYGLAFLLLEAHFVVRMNLVWGATWLASGVVIGSILATLAGGTALAMKRPLPFPLAAAGLVLGLLLGWWLPPQALLLDSSPLRLLASAGLVGLPVFFSASCFAARYRAQEDLARAFGWNLLGAVAGGLLEFGSMRVGLRGLTLVALAAYLGAFGLWRLSRPAPPARSTPA